MVAPLASLRGINIKELYQLAASLAQAHGTPVENHCTKQLNNQTYLSEIIFFLILQYFDFFSDGHILIINLMF